MNINVGDKALITMNAWFYAPDGRHYRAAFGTVRAINSDADTLGVRTNAKSTNWYLRIGRLTVAGCQIYYAVRTDAVDLGEVNDSRVTEAGIVQHFTRPSDIFDADAA